ncbi:alpha/beta fold hydrolase [Aurantimonas sp. 22II-16-19i]|uniref:alpha/beta fold hydrolase n=1 Tax=Aurantimonas sp. 22II-16-19i TaxID=1317114 RepID=UPI0009F7E2CF|nr:alpha/beta fold hydrolase [Aurantimonas sp. 22II-16-19i]ORE92738.1 dihydrolipoamide S-acetyltransferase [Aurantimonas sp. 22II-16-19i]
MIETPRLHALETGGGDEPPVVFLHGFDGRAEAFDAVAASLAGEGRRCLAFDLPGHGRSADYPGFGPPKTAARAVLAELQRRGIARAHLVGHSMGGAVGCLATLFEPGRVASLTLLAPGGFGPEIGLDPIRAAMTAETVGDLRTALGRMTAPGFAVPPDAARGNNWPEGRAAIRSVFDLLFGSGSQGVLPLAAIAETGRPIEVLWGEADQVTPVGQSDDLPPPFAVTRLPGVGHMLMLEAPAETSAAVRRAVARGEAD